MHKPIHVVQFCSSLRRACGIATYTHMLCSAQGWPAVATVEELSLLSPAPTHVHIQHEFGIMNAEILKKVLRYCKENNIRTCVTMHSVIPLPRVSRYISSRFRQKTRHWITSEHPDIRSKPWIWTADFPDYNIESFFHFRSTQVLLIKHADMLIVHSEEAARALREMGAAKVSVVDHGTSVLPTSSRLFSAHDSKLHIGCFGFLKPHKSILEVIEACSRISNCVLHIYASAAHSDRQQDYAKHVIRLASENEWIYLDTSHLPLEVVVKQLSKCDVNVWYCSPPGAISTSGSIRQYIAARRPIIASDNVMVSDIKHIITTVPFGDSDALTSAIKNYAHDEQEMHAYIEQSQWHKTRAPYESIPEYV